MFSHGFPYLQPLKTTILCSLHFINVRSDNAFLLKSKQKYVWSLTLRATLRKIVRFLGVATVYPIIYASVGVLRASGALEYAGRGLSPITNLIGFPQEALPLTLMRLVSSSASTGLLLDIYQTHSPDSFIGRFVSVMMSSTETVFYTLSVYFLSVKITKTRYTVAGALFANIVGVIASIIITILVFGR
jgi:spore maturation protein SpmB